MSPARKQSDLFTVDRSRLPGRTRTIANYIDRQRQQTGQVPTIDNVARMFAMSPLRVQHHFKLLGLLRQ
jgi:hypothetical protein